MSPRRVPRNLKPQLPDQVRSPSHASHTTIFIPNLPKKADPNPPHSTPHSATHFFFSLFLKTNLLTPPFPPSSPSTQNLNHPSPCLQLPRPSSKKYPFHPPIHAQFPRTFRFLRFGIPKMPRLRRRLFAKARFFFGGESLAWGRRWLLIEDMLVRVQWIIG